MKTCKVVLTFKSFGEIQWFGHSNETSSAVLSHDTIYKCSYKSKLEICLEVCFYTLLGVKVLNESLHIMTNLS